MARHAALGVHPDFDHRGGHQTQTMAPLFSSSARVAGSRIGLKAPKRNFVAPCRGLKENLALLPAHEDVTSVSVTCVGFEHEIPAKPGKLASVRIYTEIGQRFGGVLDVEAAVWGLAQYDEFVDEAREVTGSHPNIDLLLGVVEEGKGPYAVEISRQE